MKVIKYRFQLIRKQKRFLQTYFGLTDLNICNISKRRSIFTVSVNSIVSLTTESLSANKIVVLSYSRYSLFSNLVKELLVELLNYTLWNCKIVVASYDFNVESYLHVSILNQSRIFQKSILVSYQHNWIYETFKQPKQNVRNLIFYTQVNL